MDRGKERPKARMHHGRHWNTITITKKLDTQQQQRWRHQPRQGRIPSPNHRPIGPKNKASLKDDDSRQTEICSIRLHHRNNISNTFPFTPSIRHSFPFLLCSPPADDAGYLARLDPWTPRPANNIRCCHRRYHCRHRRPALRRRPAPPPPPSSACSSSSTCAR